MARGASRCLHMRTWSPALNPLCEEGPDNPSEFPCRAGAVAGPRQVHRAFGKYVIRPFSSWFHHACITLCVLLLSITVAISVGAEGAGRLSLCPASPHLLSRWGDQQHLAARDPWVFPKQCGTGRLGSFALLLFFIVTFFLPISGSADPQMLLMEMWPVYLLILSPLTSGLLFS